MRATAILITSVLFASIVALPWAAPPIARAQTATPTVPPTATPPAGATSTATATMTPGGATATATNTSIASSDATIVNVAATPPNTIVVTGAGFLPGAVISLDGATLQTTVTSPTSLTALLAPGFVPGPHNVTVTNPGSPPSAVFQAPLAFNTVQGPALYVPLAVRRSADDSTALFLQNIAPVPGNLTVEFFDPSGFSDPSWTFNQPVGPGESALVDLAGYSRLPLGFDGSAVVRSPQPITGVVNRSTPSSADAFSVGMEEPVGQATIPVVFGGYHGYFTTLSIQNTGPRPGTFTLSLFPTGIPSAVATIPRVIPPSAAARLRIGPEVGVPPDFVGMATITSTDSTVSVVAETFETDTGVLLSYSGFRTGANVMNAPLLFKNYGGWVSGAQVVNVSPGPVTVSGSIFQRDTPLSYRLEPRSLAPNESLTYYLPAITDLPDDFVGSAAFNASGPIALVVQQLNADRGAGMAYKGFTAGTPNISVPVVFKGSNGWDTGIQVQNLGPIDTPVNVIYHLPGGATAIDSSIVAAGSSDTFYQQDSAGIPPGAIGAATVSSLGGQPIVAIVNEVNYTRPGDASMTYNGINY